jgi:hypothetical protein
MAELVEASTTRHSELYCDERTAYEKLVDSYINPVNPGSDNKTGS